MVAFLPALSVWAIGALFAYHFVKPRLPAYAFKIRGFRPTVVNGKFAAKLAAGVWLRNDNYVSIDIHALACDVYYPDWYGALNHIGHVRDVHRTHTKEELDSLTETPPPLWEIEPRKEFETDDHVYLQPVFVGINAISSLFYDMFRGWGTLQVPSSMVVQVKANKKIDMTMTILCDNELNALTLEMVGVTCEMDSLKPGWKHLPPVVDDLRMRTIDGHQPSEDQPASIVGKKPIPPNFHEEYEKIHRPIHWRDLPMLAIA